MNLENTINPILFGKVQEIWDIFKRDNPTFVLHICSNYYNNLQEEFKKRLEYSISNLSNFKLEYHLMGDFVKKLTNKGKQIVDARISAIDKNFFEKSDGDIRALVVNLDAIDLIRIVLNDKEIRHKTEDNSPYELQKYQIMEDAFEDNVRIYLLQRTKINRNIKTTALDEAESHRFFYFNNGITITCDKFSYSPNQRHPIITLKNLQIVNGGQTIHALYEALIEKPENFQNIDLLCRIYETNDTQLSTKIAEYTNSQNAVRTRDIRAIDYRQRKLEAEFNVLGYYYERKKNHHAAQEKEKRIDAEKAGQALFALFNKMPAEAKNQKRVIFAEKYDEIFNDTINADKVLIAYNLFEFIETEKNHQKSELLKATTSKDFYETESFILHASYHLLYTIGQIAHQNDIEITYTNFHKLSGLYKEAQDRTRELTKHQRKNSKEYTHAGFFKSTRPVRLYEEHYLNGELSK